MGPMHIRGNGISASALPYNRTPPTWLKIGSQDVEENICKFAKKGMTPSQIGVILRDSHGIAQVRSVTGSKILRIFKAHGSPAPLRTGTSVLLSKNGTRSFKNPVVCAAFKSSYTHPKLTTKPKWWLRTIAAVPYLLPLHNVWQYADAVYHLHPVLEKFEFLANPFLDTMGLMPSWLIITLFMGTYFLVVRRKEWPHFLRFHVVMALLLDTGFQALATACNWLPRIAYKGQFMVYFWMAFAFSQAYTVFECMRCALTGTYHDVPFLSDAAYVHADLKLLNF